MTITTIHESSLPIVTNKQQFLNKPHPNIQSTNTKKNSKLPHRETFTNLKHSLIPKSSSHESSETNYFLLILLKLEKLLLIKNFFFFPFYKKKLFIEFGKLARWNLQKKIMILICLTVLGLIVCGYISTWIPGL